MTGEDSATFVRLYLQLMAETEPHLPDLARDMADLLRLMPVALTRAELAAVVEQGRPGVWGRRAFYFDDDEK